jgi:uncharacterized MAPEG superfamily protein
MNGTIELQMLAASAALGLVQLVLAATASVGKRGFSWALGPRDDPGAPLGNIGARIDRAFRNFAETFPFFVAAVLVASLLNKHTAMTALGAQLYFWARLAFVPVYVSGIPVLRTLVWAASLVGIILVLQVACVGM